jgi:4-oxalocrotonate tautomerase
MVVTLTHKGAKQPEKEGKATPLVEIKVFEDELTQEQTKQLIQRITDVVTGVTSEKLRDVTWVIVNTVKSGSWGIGGNALGVEDVRKIVRGG